jgi:hypothetical protein
VHADLPQQEEQQEAEGGAPTADQRTHPAEKSIN